MGFMSTNYQNILTEVREKVGIITINRPKALNAMNIDTLNELISAVKIFDDDKSVRVIIITGAGDKAKDGEKRRRPVCAHRP